jgi:hypothetical protein
MSIPISRWAFNWAANRSSSTGPSTPSYLGSVSTSSALTRLISRSSSSSSRRIYGSSSPEWSPSIGGRVQGACINRWIGLSSHSSSPLLTRRGSSIKSKGGVSSLNKGWKVSSLPIDIYCSSGSSCSSSSTLGSTAAPKDALDKGKTGVGSA